MRYKLSILLSIAFTVLSSTNTSSKINQATSALLITAGNKVAMFHPEELKKILFDRKATTFVLGKSQRGRNIEAFYFPGTSDKRALVIGGVHGSELSSIEIAKELYRQLATGDSIYYNVIIIPSLFPDNAEAAKRNPRLIGDVQNIGRYSYPGAIDPNRQMPTPGKAFDEEDSLDHMGRKTETENSILLELIDQYRPQRIVNLHAIRNIKNAGVFADPRTDHAGIALGYSSDSSLAIAIAKNIQQKGGYIPGNRLTTKPTTIYYKDPVAVAEGAVQQRNFSGSPMPGHRGGGVSLGTWASTAVLDEEYPAKNRDAIRLLTMEFPGCKRPVDHTVKKHQQFYQQQIKCYAAALKNVFLGNYFVEETKES